MEMYTFFLFLDQRENSTESLEERLFRLIQPYHHRKEGGWVVVVVVVAVVARRFFFLERSCTVLHTLLEDITVTLHHAR